MIIRKEMFKKSERSQKVKVLIPGKKFNLIKQGQNFGGVTTLPPLRKISSSRFVKSCVKKILRNKDVALVRGQ